MTTVPDGVIAALRVELLAFFDTHARTLPWRESVGPYGVWVSEIMLQQTRVDTVVPYYESWMTRFPTVSALAEAPLESVLEAWSGLGYYSRARNLHKAAAVVREEYGGRLPADLEALKALPGIGDYTAGAVASIAFQQPAPAVDGNVRRVLARLFDIETPTPAVLRAHATDLVDPARPGDFNQAVMELGATVCTPRKPECGDCPVRQHCLALARGTVPERPPTRTHKPVPCETHAVAVPRFSRGGETWTLLRRRPTSGLLGGMLEFPACHVGPSPAQARAGFSLEAAAARLLEGVALANPREAAALEPVRHRFSHLEITYHPFVFDLVAAPKEASETRASSAVRIAWSDLATAALSAAQRRIAGAAEAIAFRRRYP